MRNIIFFILIVIIVGVGFYMFGGESVEAPANIEVDSTRTENNEDAVKVVEKVFNVTGEDYVFSMTEMKVKEGDTVTVNFISTEGYHDWVVDEFAAGTERVTASNSSSVTFVASKTGEFEFYCSVGSHRAKGMIGTLIVE